jgi:hypothetical protein
MSDQGAIVNWRDTERAAWMPKSDREISLDLARHKLRVILEDLEGLHLQVQVVRSLLEIEGGDDGNKAKG